MRCNFWLASFGFLLGAIATFAEEKVFHITGTVATVGANLGTAIDGASPDWAERDAFEIDLTFNSNQTPNISGAGDGETATYRLLETVITIHGDEGALTWTYSTPAADNVSHSFGVTNDFYGGSDWFSSGLSGATFTGPALGPSNKRFSHWQLQFTQFAGTALDDTDIPSALELSALNVKEITLVFDGFGFEDDITLSVSDATVISATAIPEPSTWVAIVGGLALGFASWAKRRRRLV